MNAVFIGLITKMQKMSFFIRALFATPTTTIDVSRRDASTDALI